MKKGFYILLLLGLMPGFVLAKDAEASFKLECNPTSRRGGEVSCSLKASLTQPDNTQEGTTTGEGEGGEVVPLKEVKLNEVSASVTVDESNVFATGNTINKTNLLLTGDNKEVAKFNLQVKDNAKVGDTKIEVKIISAKDEDGNLITVTSQDLTNNVKILNNNTTLKSLQIDDKTSSCNLSQTSCTLDSVKGKTIKIGATPDDKNASVSGTGTKNLSCGNNKFTVTVTAEDKTAKKDFIINVNRTCSDNYTLKDIKVSSGSLNPTFAGNTKTYTVKVTKDIDKITINAVKGEDTQVISGEVKDKALNYGDNKFTITVKAENGNTTNYTITVNREDGRDTNNYLSSIELSSGKIKFDKEKGEYVVKVLHDIKKMSVKAVAESDKAKVEITNNDLTLKDGENTPIIIKVKSEQGIEKIYKITVNRFKEGETLGDNPRLSNITVEGYDLGFNTAKLEYTLKIKNEKQLNIKYDVEELGTEVVVKGNTNLKNGDLITISTISADGTEHLDYKIVIEKSNTLIYIIIAGIIGISSIVGIVILLIKNKKDKDNTTDLKNQIKEEDMLKHASLEKQLTDVKEKDAFGPTTPISPVGNINNNAFVRHDDINLNQNNVKEPLNTTPTFEPDLNSKINLNNYRQNFTSTNKDTEIERPVVLEDKEATRVCSICGHRVSAQLKTCPYCKRSF